MRYVSEHVTIQNNNNNNNNAFPVFITETTSSTIPTILGHRPTARSKNPIRHSVLRPICRSARITPPVINPLSAPSLYVLNAAALSKPQAIDHLAADLTSYHIDAAVITETHFKSKHSDSVVGVSGYTVFRRDRARRRGGGVALYVLSTIQSSVWTYSADEHTYELLWVRVGSNTFVGALYHPPKPIYRQLDLLNYIEACVECLSRDYPSANIILAGDLNQLSDEEMVERTGLTQIVKQPTRGVNIHDRLFVSNPQLFSIVRVVASIVRSDHKAVVAFPDGVVQPPQPKATLRRTFRRKSPTANAQFLKNAADKSFQNPQPSVGTDPAINTQAEVDFFYLKAIELLDQFYPERTVTLTTRDPDYITPEIKSMLRRKNRLMRAGRVEEAGSLAERIGKDMKRHGKSSLNKMNDKTKSKDLWAAVRQLTGRQQSAATIDGVTAESLNDHYSAISTDDTYISPLRKSSASTSEPEYITEWQVFKILDRLRPTSTGLDGLPAWFLRLGAPVFCQPITHLFNISLFNIYCAKPVEAGQNPADSQTTSAKAACRFPAHIDHTSAHQSHGENRCQPLPLPSFPLTPSIAFIH
jgi:hypothetical protein